MGGWGWNQSPRDVERKKERKTPEANGKMKMRVASGGIRTHGTLYSRQMLYQLSYQGSPAGRVRIKHLIRLYEQANLTLGIIYINFTYQYHILWIIINIYTYVHVHTYMYSMYKDTNQFTSIIGLHFFVSRSMDPKNKMWLQVACWYHMYLVISEYVSLHVHVHVQFPLTNHMRTCVI